MKKLISVLVLTFALGASASEMKNFANSSTWLSYAGWLQGMVFVGYTDTATVNHNFKVYIDRLTSFVNIANNGVYTYATKSQKMSAIASAMQTSFDRQFEYIPDYFVSDITAPFQIAKTALLNKNFAGAAKAANFALAELKRVKKEFNE